MYSTNSTNSIKQCRDTSGQQMVWTVIFSALCTGGAVQWLAYDRWLDNFLSHYTGISRNRRVSQNRDENEKCIQH